MVKIDRLLSDVANSIYEHAEQSSHWIAEKIEKPDYDKLTRLAVDYRRNGNKHSLKKFVKKISSRSPVYLGKLIVFNQNNRESLTAIANCMSQIHDEPVTPEELLDLYTIQK